MTRIQVLNRSTINCGIGLRHVQTVPDPVLESARKSKLGHALNAPGVTEDPQKKLITLTEDVRDYKLLS